MYFKMRVIGSSEKLDAGEQNSSDHHNSGPRNELVFKIFNDKIYPGLPMSERDALLAGLCNNLMTAAWQPGAGSNDTSHA